MTNITIPTGLEYVFTLRVLQRDSFLPQNLAHLDPQYSSLVIKKTEDGETMFVIPVIVQDAQKGIVMCRMTATNTQRLQVERGDKVDGYYSKPLYKGILQIYFTDNTVAITSIIENIAAISVYDATTPPVQEDTTTEEL